MNDKMMKLLMSKKKKGEGLSDSEKKSKTEALQGMKDMASSMMSDKLKNLKKVTVASDSSKGLEAGLHKAEEMIGSESDKSEEPMGQESAEMPEEFQTDEDDKINELVDECSDNLEDIDKVIAKLEEKKKELSQKM